MRSWIDYLAKTLYILITVSFLAAVVYMIAFIVTDRAPLIHSSPVTVINEWTYTDQLGGQEKIKTPARIDREGRDEFIFEAKLPDVLPEGAVIAFLNRVDLTVEVNGQVIKEWDTDDAPIIGGPAKNSYFILPLRHGDEGGTIKISQKSDQYGGKFFDAFVGERNEVVRYLEVKSGGFQFIMSLVLLVMSLGITIAGLFMRFVIREQIRLIYISMGIFVTSAWMVVDSFVFQFVSRSQFIDGFISYMTTLTIIFPFVAYLDAITDHRYRKWYVGVVALEFINFYLFSFLHVTRRANFSQSLLLIDIIIGVGILVCMFLLITDIRKGFYKSYKYVSYGFLAFMIMALIEIILINTVVERVEGGAMIAGLYILFAFAIIQQLAEIRHAQIERDREKEESITKTKFLASMSHEIRTPINSILGMNEMILKESRDPNIVSYAGIIGDSGSMLLSLINDILDFSKIGNDMEEIVNANYDPGKMFDNAAEVLRIQTRKKGLTAKVGKPKNLPDRLYGDEKKINRIIVNLLSNAVKYTNEGTVTFTGECFEREGRYVLCFYVSDTGIGIREEDLDGIFDPFHRLDLKKNQNIQGTGLGLSIVKSLVEKMGGEIKVESVYGKGTTFSVRLPQQPMAEMEDERYNSGNAIEDDRLDEIDTNYIAPEARLLEVDDNISNQMVVKQFLKETGMIIDTAADGKEALRLAKSNRYDIILMDHMMPGMDGIETMHRIRSEEGSLNTETPVVVLTANAIMGSRAKYEAEGFDNYLSKPVESVRLLKMVRKYLPDNKVMYKPKKRQTSMMSPGAAPSAQGSPAHGPFPEGPVDFEALYARFDNRAETVNMILEEIVKEGNRKIPLLRQLAADEDIKRYAVEAHGIKGVMSSSCIPELSAIAKAHELAAKEGKLDFIKANVESFLKEYGDVCEFITKYLENK
ncbi:MAG: response regulator [Lachnospiraceae bacterium]|nr:response regulator [Lachnospiraceae bacterium]